MPAARTACSARTAAALATTAAGSLTASRSALRRRRQFSSEFHKLVTAKFTITVRVKLHCMPNKLFRIVGRRRWTLLPSFRPTCTRPASSGSALTGSALTGSWPA